jgi:hypothetical protein
VLRNAALWVDLVSEKSHLHGEHFITVVFHGVFHAFGRFLGRIPLVAYVVIGAFAFIALSNWATKFGWTQASNAIKIADYPDWLITLNNEQKMRCRLLAASPERYVVVCRNGADTIVQTIPRSAVSRIDYDSSIKWIDASIKASLWGNSTALTAQKFCVRRLSFSVARSASACRDAQGIFSLCAEKIAERVIYRGGDKCVVIEVDISVDKVRNFWQKFDRDRIQSPVLGQRNDQSATRIYRVGVTIPA